MVGRSTLRVACALVSGLGFAACSQPTTCGADCQTADADTATAIDWVGGLDAANDTPADSAVAAGGDAPGDTADDQAVLDVPGLDPPDVGSDLTGPPNVWIGQPLWLLSIDNGSRWLQKVDVATGKTTNLCQLPNKDAYPSLTFRRDNVLVASRKGAGLDEIDPCTCAVKQIGSYGGGATGVNGITTNHAQGLFGISAGLGALIAINPQSGAATMVGNGLGVVFGAHGATWSDKLQQLVAINSKDDGLYLVDPQSGQAKLQAKLSKPFGSVGIERHPGNDTIYACSDDKILRQVDMQTGLVTDIGPMAQLTACTNLAAPFVPMTCPGWPKN